MKYIVVSKTVGSITREFPILFPNDLSHVDVANALMVNCPELKHGTVVGAGEMSAMCIDADCSGRSSTLNVNSREDRDNAAFEMRDYTGGIV